jgi:outer membrane protein assembly factor BamB
MRKKLFRSVTRRLSVLAPIVVLALAASVRGQAQPSGNSWPQWRGPFLNGSSTATGLPDKLDKDRNLAWSVPLAGPGAGTPIVWENRIFVSALDAQSKKLLALCLDRSNGATLWRKEVGVGFTSNDRNNMASPSPVTDGKTVWFYYGTGDLAAFDFSGKQLWARNIQNDYGPFNVQWIYGSSALLYDGKLIVQVLHRDVPPHGPPPAGAKPADSYLLALDPQTGKDLWKVVRPNEAKAESKESYATPVPFDGSPRKEVVVIGGDAVTGHDAETGKELWRVGGWNPSKIGHWRVVPSVVTGDGLAFACAPKGGPVIAIKAGGQGDVTGSHVAWKSKDFSSDVCVPLYYNKQLYVLDGDARPGRLYCVEPQSGKVKWTRQLEGSEGVFRASPTGADGKIYCMNERAQAWVLSADDGKVLNRSSLDTPGVSAPSRASIAAVDGNVLVRAADTLYCFKK